MSETARPDPLKEWLEAAPFSIGEIRLDRARGGGFELCHRDDAGREEITVHATPEAALDLARYDEAGKYRPLKTAPDLRHGWLLRLADAREARLALDLFYPGRLAAFAAWKDGSLRATPFRETLARQSGMYRAAAKITDEQADGLIGEFCRSDGGCLRTMVWRRDSSGGAPSSRLPAEKFDPRFDQTGHGERVLPLLCQEACNLLVAAARNAVKAAE